MFKKTALGRTGGMDTAFQTTTHFLTLRSAVTLSRTIPEVFDESLWRPFRKLPEALSRRTSRRRESCRRLLRPRLFPNSSRVGIGVVMLTERAIVFPFYSMLWIGPKDIVTGDAIVCRDPRSAAECRTRIRHRARRLPQAIRQPRN